MNHNACVFFSDNVNVDVNHHQLTCPDKYTDITGELSQLKTKITNMKKYDCDLYSDEILREIKEELALRYLGMEGRIKHRLETDLQIQSALDVINDPVVYANLLNVH